jgi:hypothetical protein
MCVLSRVHAIEVIVAGAVSRTCGGAVPFAGTTSSVPEEVANAMSDPSYDHCTKTQPLQSRTRWAAFCMWLSAIQTLRALWLPPAKAL